MIAYQYESEEEVGPESIRECVDTLVQNTHLNSPYYIDCRHPVRHHYYHNLGN